MSHPYLEDESCAAEVQSWMASQQATERPKMALQRVLATMFLARQRMMQDNLKVDFLAWLHMR